MYLTSRGNVQRLVTTPKQNNKPISIQKCYTKFIFLGKQLDIIALNQFVMKLVWWFGENYFFRNVWLVI